MFKIVKIALSLLVVLSFVLAPRAGGAEGFPLVQELESLLSYYKDAELDKVQDQPMANYTKNLADAVVKLADAEDVPGEAKVDVLRRAASRLGAIKRISEERAKAATEDVERLEKEKEKAEGKVQVEPKK